MCSTHLFDGRLKVPSEERPFQVAFLADGHMANHLAAADENSTRIRKQRAAIEAEVYVAAVGGDMAESVLHRFAGKRETDRDGIPLGDRLDRLRRFVENDVSQS